MKKRVLCLCLSLVMVLSVVLTGCNQDDEGNVAVENKHAMTITMAMIKGDNATDDDCALVEKALNVITESRLNTHIEIDFFTAAEYEEKVLAKISDIGNKLKGGQQLAADGMDEESTEPEEKKYDEETGREIVDWPAVSDTQYDIVYIDGIEQFYKFNEVEIALSEDDMEVGLLAPINPTSSLLGQYVNYTLLSTATTPAIREMGAEGVYAIPNNRDFGRYTYLVVNKELADTYLPELSEEDWAKHKQCFDKGDLLKTHTIDGDANGYKTSVELLNGSLYGNFLSKVHEANPELTLVQGLPGPENIFYTFDSEVMVGAGNFIAAGNKLDTLFEAPPKNLYANASVKSYYELVWQLKQWGHAPSEEVDFSKDFAVAYVKGNANSIAEVDTDKYYVKVTDAPVKSNETVYDNMYGVTKYSIDTVRATEVVELFNTNADFRNILYYGIENIHYQENDHGEREFLPGNTWDMDMFRTGNLYLLTPPSKQTFIDELGEELGTYYYQLSSKMDDYEALGNWAAGKLLNSEAIDGLLLNFCVDNDNPQIKTSVDDLRVKCAAWNERLLADDVTDISILLDQIKTEMDADKSFLYLTADLKTMATKPYESVTMRFKYLSDLMINGNDADPSVLKQYRKWYESMTGK